MFTSKFVLRGDSKSLKLRITLNRKTTEISVPNVFVEPKDLENALSTSPRDCNAVLAKNLKDWEARISVLRLHLLESKNLGISLKEIRDMINAELFGKGTGEEDESARLDRRHCVLGNFIFHFAEISI